MIQSFAFPDRREVAARLAPMLKTGDILVRRSKTKGPFGIPFSDLVCDLTESDWSHPAIVFREGDKVWVLEVGDAGVMQLRLIDWFPYCVGNKFLVLRHKEVTPAIEALIMKEIEVYLETDMEYDFTYSDPTRTYCTGSVCDIFSKVGITLAEPMTPRQVFGKDKMAYAAFVVGNSLVKRLTGKGFQLNAKMYFVGNDQQGILACPKLHLIYSHDG